MHATYSRLVLTTHAPTQPPPAGAAVRWAGPADPALLAGQPSRGRRRRWVYVAAGDERVTVGAAVVDVGVFGLGTAFAFATGPWGIVRWDAGPGRAGQVGGLLASAATRRAGGSIDLTPEGLVVDVPVDGGRLQATVEIDGAAPVSLLTPTSAGGWNATTKRAGEPAHGTITTPHGTDVFDGGAWTDATDGRQDRHTVWRWAAGAGRSIDGTARVGLQASTGMNARGPGEDLVWWDGVPHPLSVTALAPVRPEAFDGAWTIRGENWSMELSPTGVRAADEGLGPIRSRYHQPVGTWRGTLPGPSGAPVPVWLAGVAEDHEARW